MHEEREAQPAVLIQWLKQWSTKSFSDHPLCAQQCAKHKQSQEEWEVLPAQMSAYKLNFKTNAGISFSKLGF